MMFNLRKIAVFLTVFAGITSFSFADTFLSFSTGLTRLNEQYPDEDYGRDLDGFSLNVMVNQYRGNSPVGWFIRTSIGDVTNSFEWAEDNWDPTSLSYTGIRISAGPSFRIKAGPVIQIPISIGPVFSNYRKQSDYWQSFSCNDVSYHNTGPEVPGVENPPFERPPEEPPVVSPSSREDYYEAFNLGLLFDAAFIINPFGRFTFINGITISYDFMHWEKDYGSSPLSNRNGVNARLRTPNYSAFTVDFYFGIGILLGNSYHRRGNDNQSRETGDHHRGNNRHHTEDNQE